MRQIISRWALPAVFAVAVLGAAAPAWASQGSAAAPSAPHSGLLTTAQVDHVASVTGDTGLRTLSLYQVGLYETPRGPVIVLAQTGRAAQIVANRSQLGSWVVRHAFVQFADLGRQPLELNNLTDPTYSGPDPSSDQACIVRPAPGIVHYLVFTQPRWNAVVTQFVYRQAPADSLLVVEASYLSQPGLPQFTQVQFAGLNQLITPSGTACSMQDEEGIGQLAMDSYALAWTDSAVKRDGYAQYFTSDPVTGDVGDAEISTSTAAYASDVITYFTLSQRDYAALDH